MFLKFSLGRQDFIAQIASDTFCIWLFSWFFSVLQELDCIRTTYKSVLNMGCRQNELTSPLFGKSLLLSIQIRFFADFGVSILASLLFSDFGIILTLFCWRHLFLCFENAVLSDWSVNWDFCREIRDELKSKVTFVRKILFAVNANKVLGGIRSSNLFVGFLDKVFAFYNVFLKIGVVDEILLAIFAGIEVSILTCQLMRV